MKTCYYFLCTLLIASLVYCPTVSSQTFSSNGSHSERIDSLVNGYFNQKRFSGSVLVADQGKIIFSKEYGYLEMDSLKKIDSESVFEIASLSKQFTALLIMMLKEEGKLKYDDKVTDYLPGFPCDGITIRHLLTHTSGLSERQFFIWAGKNMNPKETYSNKFILKYLMEQKPSLSFDPGEKWEYSNLGYFVLPLIIEKLTEQHYIQFLNEKILKPLNMDNTGIFSQEVKGNAMKNYVLGKVFLPKDSTYMSGFGMAKSDSIYGSVGILSNTRDLFKWDRALYTNKLVGQKTLQEAFSPFVLADGTSSDYGFGWFVKTKFAVDGIRCGTRVDHYGLWPGYESSIVRYIDSDKTIILLANQSPSAKDKLVEEITKILFSRIQ